MGGLRERLRAVAWYFGIGSAPEAERRRLEREEADEVGRPWWREAAGLGGVAVVVEVVRVASGVDDFLWHDALPLAVFVAATFVVAVWIRSRSGERPPVD